MTKHRCFICKYVSLDYLIVLALWCYLFISNFYFYTGPEVQKPKRVPVRFEVKFNIKSFKKTASRVPQAICAVSWLFANILSLTDSRLRVSVSLSFPLTHTFVKHATGRQSEGGDLLCGLCVFCLLLVCVSHVALLLLAGL